MSLFVFLSPYCANQDDLAPISYSRKAALFKALPYLYPHSTPNPDR